MTFMTKNMLEGSFRLVFGKARWIPETRVLFPTNLTNTILKPSDFSFCIFYFYFSQIDALFFTTLYVFFLSIRRFCSHLSDSSENLFRYSVLPLRITIKVNHNKKGQEVAFNFKKHLCFAHTFYCFTHKSV